ncbi:hypothetical protein NMY22_g16691 [Coprinellus aureogranulatus]|nr:hypothetical protein NMY22_g16691 [Coprinellus aureogranulatus]
MAQAQLDPVNGNLSSMTKDSRLQHLFSTSSTPSAAGTTAPSLQPDLQVPVSEFLQAHIMPTQLEELSQPLLLAPAHRLPIELLDQVFSHVDPRDLNRVALVCRSWHTASITRSNGRYLDIHICFKAKDGMPCKWIGSWLAKARSGTNKRLQLTPIPPTYCPCLHGETKCCWRDEKFLPLLSDLSSSSVQMDLTFTSISCLRNLIHSLETSRGSLSAAGRPWDTLRSLKITITSGTMPAWNAESEPYHTIFNHLPKALTSLTLSIRPPSHDATPRKLTFPKAAFNSLTYLAIDCHWRLPIEMSTLLRQCVHLRTLHINLGCHAQTHDSLVLAEGDEHQQDVVLPKLHTLELLGVEESMVPIVLQPLNLPSLTRLTVKYPRLCMVYNQALQTIMGGLRLVVRGHAWASSLRSLLVNRMEIEAASLAEILVGVPLLEHLSMVLVDFDAQHLLKLERLRSEPMPRPVLPNIRTITLRDVRSGFQTKAFLRYIELRSVRLREVDQLNGITEIGIRARDSLRRITIQYWEWHEGTQANWKGCSKLARRLKGTFGVTVERVVSQGEWREYGKAGFDFRRPDHHGENPNIGGCNNGSEDDDED